MISGSTGSILSARAPLNTASRGSPKGSQISDAKTPVTDGTEEFAVRKHRSASTLADIFVKDAVDHTELMNARRKELAALEPRAKRPRYTRGLLWDDGDDVLSATAQYSLSATPVPRVPLAESSNPVVKQTIADHPHLFKIDCHINVTRFEELLHHHPNQPFVKSVCHALHEGFWPWADTKIRVYPETWDFSD